MSLAPKGAGGKGEKSGVRDHNPVGQPAGAENTCPVQLPLRRLELDEQSRAQRDDYANFV